MLVIANVGFLISYVGMTMNLGLLTICMLSENHTHEFSAHLTNL